MSWLLGIALALQQPPPPPSTPVRQMRHQVFKVVEGVEYLALQFEAAEIIFEGEKKWRFRRPHVEVYPEGAAVRRVSLLAEMCRLNEASSLAEASDAVLVTTSDGDELKTNSLNVRYDVERLTTSSPVAIAYGTMHVSGNGLDADSELDRITLHRHVAIRDKGGVTRSPGRLDIDERKIDGTTFYVFTLPERVRMVRRSDDGETVIDADWIEMTSRRDPATNDVTPVGIEARGRVRVLRPDGSSVSADTLHWNDRDRVVVLEDAAGVVVSSEGRTLRAPRARLEPDSNRAFFEGGAAAAMEDTQLGAETLELELRRNDAGELEIVRLVAASTGDSTLASPQFSLRAPQFVVEEGGRTVTVPAGPRKEMTFRTSEGKTYVLIGHGAVRLRQGEGLTLLDGAELVGDEEHLQAESIRVTVGEEGDLHLLMAYGAVRFQRGADLSIDADSLLLEAQRGVLHVEGKPHAVIRQGSQTLQLGWARIDTNTGDLDGQTDGGRSRLELQMGAERP